MLVACSLVEFIVNLKYKLNFSIVAKMHHFQNSATAAAFIIANRCKTYFCQYFDQLSSDLTIQGSLKWGGTWHMGCFLQLCAYMYDVWGELIASLYHKLIKLYIFFTVNF